MACNAKADSVTLEVEYLGKVQKNAERFLDIKQGNRWAEFMKNLKSKSNATIPFTTLHVQCNIGGRNFPLFVH